MNGFLGADQRAAFHRDGVLFPLPAFDIDEIERVARRLRAIGRARAGRLPPAFNLKPHLLVPSLWEMVHDQRILDPVESLLGPDLLCWGSSFFDKSPGGPQHVHWHQDATYWGLDRPDALTAWVAFTPSVVENGCMRVVPGTHARQLPHEESFDPHNMLPGREKLSAGVDDGSALDVQLAAGEMSLHHVLIVHGSRPNLSNAPRTGFAIRYIAGDAASASGDRGSATLVRGRDHGTFDLEREPEGELHPDALKRHVAVLRQATRIVAAEVRRTQPMRDASA